MKEGMGREEGWKRMARGYAARVSFFSALLLSTLSSFRAPRNLVYDTDASPFSCRLSDPLFVHTRPPEESLVTVSIVACRKTGTLMRQKAQCF